MGWVVAVIAALILGPFIACEVITWFGMRHFRDEDEAFRRHARSRIRRAFWDGYTSIGFHR